MSSICTFSKKFVIFFLLAGGSSAAFGLGGNIIFSGRIVEPACSVHAHTVVLSAANNTVPLNVYCHGDQSARISFQDAGAVTGHATFSIGTRGAEISIRHGSISIAPGDTISYAFNGKKEMVIPFTASLHKPDNIADDGDAEHVTGSMLVSFEYR